MALRRLLVAVLTIVLTSWVLCYHLNIDRHSIYTILRLRNHYKTSDASPDALIYVTNFALIDVTTNQTLIASLLKDVDDDKNIFVLDLDQLVSVSSSATSLAYSNNGYHANNNKLKLTLRVDAQGPVYYMVMDWDDGDVVRTSLRQPFALAGLDDHQNQEPSRFGHALALTTPGRHSLQATPYDAEGRAGRSRTLQLRVVQGSSSNNKNNNDALLMKVAASKQSTTTTIQQSFAGAKNFFIRPPTERERQREQQVPQQGDENDQSHDKDLPQHLRQNHPPTDRRNHRIIIYHQIVNNASTTTMNAAAVEKM